MMPTISGEMFNCFLNELERDFKEKLPYAHREVNLRRAAKGKPLLTLAQANTASRLLGGGDLIDFLVTLEIES